MFRWRCFRIFFGQFCVFPPIAWGNLSHKMLSQHTLKKTYAWKAYTLLYADAGIFHQHIKVKLVVFAANHPIFLDAVTLLILYFSGH